ncbi:hypothetical protein NHX12_022642 [Muraenolepis orangiensis]|uniref:Neuronal PAS domain-containing protein 4-like n=1 Tax=Muraenolepis orangiensis TaxID=630683 RepID=A0A9Q0ES00_9TELE|nr:hypothetical protein NHX12_022642 [Muraenolepis orangiensis]
MTIWCDFCKSQLSLPCSLHQCSVETRAACKRSRSSRSTKGASKVRRDHINAEIRSMRALLPFPPEDQERLSYLHSMSAICTYLRKSVLLQGVPGGQVPGSSLPYETFLPALHGFILVVSTQGKLVYVSENVAEYLGHSMVDILQGDTVYDMIDRADINTVKAQLESDSCSTTERSFVCCMQTSKAVRLQQGQRCSMLVRGCFRPASPASEAGQSRGECSLFVALCTPTVDRSHGTQTATLVPGFGSFHAPDLSFAGVSDSVFYYLGYTVEEMSSRSWYSLLHPDDLQRTAGAHKSLVQANEGCEVEMVSRLQHKDLYWTWIYTRATSHCDSQSIHCANYIISESEALYLVKKINRDAFGPSLTEADLCPPQAVQTPRPQSYSPAEGFKRQRGSDSQHEEPTAKARRAGDGEEGEQDVHRVVPASSDCSPQTEATGCDFLMDLHGYADLSPSSPESSPSYYPYLDGGYEVAAACEASARLVPDCLTMPDTLGSPEDRCSLEPEDFAVLQQPQGGSAFQSHHVPHVVSSHSSLLTPSPSPTSLDSFQYDDREHVEISILAQQISSLANSFDLYGAVARVHGAAQLAEEEEELPLPACDWPKISSLPTAAALPFKPELVLDDSVIDSILKELAVVDTGAGVPCGPSRTVSQGSPRGHPCEMMQAHQGTRSMAGQTAVDPRPLEPFTVTHACSVDPFAMPLGSHQQNPGLHQLSRYIRRGLQRDGLLEDALY